MAKNVIIVLLLDTVLIYFKSNVKQVIQLILITLDASFLMASIASRVWGKRSQLFPFNAQRQAREVLVPFFYVWPGHYVFGHYF